MRFSKVYIKGEKDINEDSFVLNEKNKIFGVMDGATGLGGLPGHIASYSLSECLQLLELHHSMKDAIVLANKLIFQKTIDFFQHNSENRIPTTIEEIPKNLRSSSGLAVIKMNESNSAFEFIHAGDCMIFLKYTNGDIRILTNDLIGDLDQAVIREMARIMRLEPSLVLDQVRLKVNSLLLKNRQKLNTPTGYGVIDGSKDSLEYLEYGRVLLNRVTKIALLSDGLQIPFDLEEKHVWRKSAELAFSSGIEALRAEVERKEAQDPDCKLYPRLKPKDDKAGILIEL